LKGNAQTGLRPCDGQTGHFATIAKVVQTVISMLTSPYCTHVRIVSYQHEAGKNYPESAQSARDVIYRLECLLIMVDTIAHDTPDTWRFAAEELNQAITDIMAPARARATRGEKVSDQVTGDEAA